MKSIETAIDIDASADRVWQVLVDFPSYAAWNPFIREAAGEPRVGRRLFVRIHPPGGKPMTFRPVVKEARPGEELRWLGSLLVPGIFFDGEHRFRIVEAERPTACRLLHTEEFRGLLVAFSTGATWERIRSGFEAMNTALKERAEQGR